MHSGSGYLPITTCSHRIAGSSFPTRSSNMARHSYLCRVMLLSLFCVLSSLALVQKSNAQQPSNTQQPSPAIHNDVVIKGGTVLTLTHGKIENGSIYIHNGKIAEVGQRVNAPAGATVIDATGKFVMPGIIDSHSHIALDDDVNEPTSPITPHMMMRDAFDYNDKAIYRALAGGVTTSLLLHGSANMIGGQAIVIKHKYGLGS